MTRLLAFALLGSLSLTACAQPAAPGGATGQAAKPVAAKAPSSGDAGVDANIAKALKQLGPQLEADYIGQAPLPGFREVIVGGQLLYISDDGKYLVQGSVVDIANREDLSQTSSGLRNYRKQLIAGVPRAERIVFAPPNPKYTLSVFTDIECGYCRKMHSEIAEYNRQGIAVEYLAFPRMGLGSQDHKDMISVWCASDRRKALTDAKSSGAVAAKDCTNPVAREYDLGQRVGVTGTPAVFAADGTQLGGYLPPAQMRAALDKLGAAATAGGMK
jgi:thiol:disulfide interchange protein DsbC